MHKSPCKLLPMQVARCSSFSGAEMETFYRGQHQTSSQIFAVPTPGSNLSLTQRARILGLRSPPDCRCRRRRRIGQRPRRRRTGSGRPARPRGRHSLRRKMMHETTCGHQKLCMLWLPCGLHVLFPGGKQASAGISKLVQLRAVVTAENQQRLSAVQHCGCGVLVR